LLLAFSDWRLADSLTKKSGVILILKDYCQRVSTIMPAASCQKPTAVLHKPFESENKIYPHDPS